jgi:hypothetical protein
MMLASPWMAFAEFNAFICRAGVRLRCYAPRSRRD